MSGQRNRTFDQERAKSLHRRAIADGAKRRGLGTLEWDVSGFCEHPVFVTVGGHWTPIGVEGLAKVPRTAVWQGPGDKHPLATDIFGPCRKCIPCLISKRNFWTMRMIREIAAAPRTWFCSLTMNPQHRVVMELRALRGVSQFKNEADKWFRLHDEFGKEVTKFLKRVRKGNEEYPGPHRFRYSLVGEAHEDGFPHFHMLLHEVEGSNPLRHKFLRKKWRRLGFSDIELVEDGPDAAAYCAKYLVKSENARVRASKRYGQDHVLITEHLSEMRAPH